MKAVSLQLPNPDWEKCYYIMLSALYGYNITLDPNEYDRRIESNNLNWSKIHAQLIQELITTSLKMQKETLAMRHLSFILQCLFNSVTPSQRQEFAANLSSLASKCGEDSPVELKLSNGFTIPSVNFTKFPMVTFFKVEPLKPHLRPIKLKLNNSDEEELNSLQKNSGPFIYTPLQLNRTPVDHTKSHKVSVTKVKFFWTEGNACAITMSLHNFLSIELNISSIMLMTDGVAFEPNHETALKIAPGSSYSNITLNGIPRSSGILDILGYKIHALGIKSDCKLSQLPNARKLKLPAKFSVEIVPRLPLMCAQCLKYNSANDIRLEKGLDPLADAFPDKHVSNSYFISLYAGKWCFKKAQHQCKL